MLFSLGLFFAKKTPKLLCTIITIVNIVMIFFVVNGSTHDSDAYSNLYLVEYKFNTESAISPILSSQYSQQHKNSSLNNFSMKVGFMGVCVDFGNDLNCGYTSDMETAYENEVPSFSVVNNESENNTTITNSTIHTSSVSLELFEIAQKIQNKSIKYHIFIVEIVYLLFLLLIQTYSLIGFLPFQIYVSYFISFVLGSFMVILCISITWLMVSCHDLVSVGMVMTMNILSFTKGNKTQNILWAVFTLTFIQIFYYLWTFVKVNKLVTGLKSFKFEKDIEKDAGSFSGSGISSITTLRETL